MSLAGTAAITELWAKCKLWFGRSLATDAASTTVDVMLKNNGNDTLSTGTIPASTSSAAGVMTAAQYSKLDGIAAGATANAATTTTPQMDGTAAVGADSGFARGDHVHPTDTSRAAVSHADTSGANGVATGLLFGHIRLSDAIDGTEASATGGRAATPKAVSDALTAAKDYTDDAISASGYDDFTGATESTAGTHGLVPAPTIGDTTNFLRGNGTWADVVDVIPTATSSMLGLMSNTDKAKLDALIISADIPHATCSTAASTAAKVATLDNSDTFTLTTGAVVAVTFTYGNSATTPTLNVNSTGAKSIAIPSSATAYTTGSGTTYNSWGAHETLLFTYTGTYWVHLGSGYLQQMAYKLAAAAAPKASPTLTGTPKAPTATAGTNTEQIATTEFVTTAIANAQTGASVFQGTVSDNSTISGSSYKSGWYWVVATAGTYVGQTCEVGDMVFAIADKGSAYSASDFSVVQNNVVEMTAAEVDAICV